MPRAIHVSNIIKESDRVRRGIPNTPNGWVCALHMQSSTMSSSKMEEASSGVPSLLMIETTSNLSGKGSGD